jgi:hypothetical protein
MQSQYPQSRKANILVVEMDGEVLVYDQKINKAFNLNKTSALIWELCDGKHSLSEISRLLGEKLNADVEDGLVWLALEQLREENLIENEVALPESLIGLSRRQAIRKVGLAAVITLPFISSLVAPTAMHAQSADAQPGPAPRRVTTPTSSPVDPIFAPTPISFAPQPLSNPPSPFPPLTPLPPSPPFNPIFAPQPISNPIDF